MTHSRYDSGDVDIDARASALPDATEPRPHRKALDLAAESIDGLIEALLACTDAEDRAAVIEMVIEELCAAAAWQYDPVRERLEAVSLRSVREAARAHHWRMGTVAATTW